MYVDWTSEIDGGLDLQMMSETNMDNDISGLPTISALARVCRAEVYKHHHHDWSNISRSLTTTYVFVTRQGRTSLEVCVSSLSCLYRLQ